MIIDNRCSKSPHIRTYQNKNREAVFPKLCTLQLRTCFSLMKHRFLLQGLQSSSSIVVIKVIVVIVVFESFIRLPNNLLCPLECFQNNKIGLNIFMRLSSGLHKALFKYEPINLEISLSTFEIRTNFSLARKSRFLYAGIYCTIYLNVFEKW